MDHAVTEGTARLRLKAAETAVISGDVTIHIPGECAKLSVLISDLREQPEDEELVPLLLTMHEVRAWLACANVADSELQDDDTMLAALKVRPVEHSVISEHPLCL